jgi:hypothetical protein
MATRQDIENEIADDLDRSDLSGQITNAVNAAIRAYRFERLTFNEAYRVTATLSISLASISLSSLTQRFRRIDRLRLQRNTSDYLDLYKRDYGWIMSRQDIPTAAQPVEYCVYNDTLHFDSAADQSYTLLIDGLVDLGTGTSATFSQSSVAAWFNEARQLVRHRAKREIYAHVLKDIELASVAKGGEDDALRTLKAEQNEQNGTGYIRPTEF